MSSEDAAVVEPVRPDGAGEVRRVEVDGHAFLNEEDLLGTFDSGQTAITWDRAVAFLRVAPAVAAAMTLSPSCSGPT